MVWKVHLRWCRTTLKTWVTHVYHLQSSIKNVRSGVILMCKTVQTDCGGIKSLKTMLSLSASWLGVRAPKSNNTPGGGLTRTNKNILVADCQQTRRPPIHLSYLKAASPSPNPDETEVIITPFYFLGPCPIAAPACLQMGKWMCPSFCNEGKIVIDKPERAFGIL